MDEFLISGISSSFWTSDYCFRQCQQPGADFQFGVRRRIQVDFEPHLLVLQKKPDHPAFVRKVFGLSHAQHRCSSELCQRRGDELLLRRPKEYHLTTLRLLCLFKVQYANRPAINRLPVQAGVQRSMERIVPDRAVGKRAASVFESFRRPINKLCKMKKKSGLHLIFARWIGLRRNPLSDSDRYQSSESRDGES